MACELYLNTPVIESSHWAKQGQNVESLASYRDLITNELFDFFMRFI